MLPDEPNDEEKLEQLPGDGQTPFRPAAPGRDDSILPDNSAQPGQPFDNTQPRTDTDVDQQELYDAGEESAVGGADDPHDDTTVTGYNQPDQDVGSPS